MDAFYDFQQGGAWYSQISHRTPMSRLKDIQDQAVPSSNGILIQQSLLLYQHYDDLAYYKIALDALSAFMTMAIKSTKGCETFWLGMSSYWQLFDSNDFDCQFIRCSKKSESMYELLVDLILPNIDHP